jgi:uncharacterized protein YeaO (DUF488 family)
MEAQLYLDELISESKTFFEELSNLRKDFPEFFNNFTAQYISTLKGDKMQEYFKISQIMNDNQITFNKIASYLEFCSKIGIKLDLTKLSEIQGLTEFISNFKPFETDFIKTSEGKLEIKNLELNKNKFKNFKENIINILKMGLINES